MDNKRTAEIHFNFQQLMGILSLHLLNTGGLPEGFQQGQNITTAVGLSHDVNGKPTTVTLKLTWDDPCSN